MSRRAISADVLTPKEARLCSCSRSLSHPLYLQLLQLERRVFGELLADSLPAQDSEPLSVSTTDLEQRPVPESVHSQENEEGKEDGSCSVLLTF